MAAIDIQRAGATAILTMNRPEQRNALDYPTSRYMHEYGLERRQLGEVALAARCWAELNPDAFMRERLTMEDYLKARMVSDPISVRDCCLVTDGAAAVVMVSAERAAHRPAPRLGEHTREILKEFSFSDDEIDKLVAIGAARIGARNKDSGATSTGRAT
jgi:crotonobetainyl-CoA:carnitine CoA-transferase CaiB-like acyl-CoA transferase